MSTTLAPAPIAGARAFAVRKRQVTLIGLVYLADATPRLLRVSTHLTGPLDQRGLAGARRALMRSAAARFRVPLEDIEVHDVMVLSGFAKEIAPEHLTEQPQPQQQVAA